MNERVRSAIYRYGLALIIFIVIIVTAALLEQASLKVNMSLPVVIGLVVATWFGGRGPGLLLAILVQIVTIFSNGVAPDSTVALTAFGHFSVFALLVLIVVLIAARRSAEESLEKRVKERTEQLDHAKKELEAFSYSVSHDLRAPLRHISGFSGILLEDYTNELDEAGKSYLRQISESVEEMRKMIDDILELSKVSRTELALTQVDLSDLATMIGDEIRRMDPERKVTINIHTGLTAYCDEDLLKIVLRNLIGNAWKFTSKTADPRIEIGRMDPDRAVFFVRDNGAGFDMEQSEKLFEAFGRLHSASEFDGTGIGLATVQRIMSRHNGRIWADGETGKGATFYFELEQAPQ
jgi:light-regulated signal transduction histidine kinase (bacteriophytochrome)